MTREREAFTSADRAEGEAAEEPASRFSNEELVKAMRKIGDELRQNPEAFGPLPQIAELIFFSADTQPPA